MFRAQKKSGQFSYAPNFLSAVTSCCTVSSVFFFFLIFLLHSKIKGGPRSESPFESLYAKRGDAASKRERVRQVNR